MKVFILMIKLQGNIRTSGRIINWIADTKWSQKLLFTIRYDYTSLEIDFYKMAGSNTLEDLIL